MKISAVVLTKNEEKNIKGCLKSLDFCDEMIVVDDFSPDRTREIAREHGARVFQRRLAGDFASQRKLGLRKAKNDWVLFIDADERISPALAGEILNYESRIMNYDGFYFKRRDFFLGCWLKHGETSRVRLLRLARKNSGRWQGRVHETWQVKGKIGDLEEPLLHYPHPSLTEFLEKINHYTSLRAREEKNFFWSQLFFYPLLKFSQNYFFRLGFLDGWAGLMMAWLMSFHSLVVRVKTWEKNQGQPRQSLKEPMLVFLGIAFFSWLIRLPGHSLTESFIALAYLGRWLFLALAYFYLRVSWRWLLGFGLVSAAIGWLQYLFWPDMRWLSAYGWDDHYYRLIVPFLDPAFTGLILVLTLILIVQEFWSGRAKNSPPFAIRYSLFAICYSALALTYSRSSYLAYLIAMAMIAYQKKAKKFFLGIISLFLMTLLLLPQPAGEGAKLERTSTIAARIRNYQQSWQIVKDQPWLGIGFNFYRDVQRDYGFLQKDWQTSHSAAGADSSLLFVWATTGIFGLLAFLWLVGRMFQIEPISVTAVFVHSLFNHSFFYPWVLLWLWLRLGSKERS